jgi:2-haloacid dehalogenase
MKNIIFDFGGVLLKWSPDYFYLPYFNGDKRLMEEFYATTQIKAQNQELDRGVAFDAVLKSLIAKFPHYEKPIILWKNAWHKMIGGEIDGSIEILKKLDSNGYQLYGLTNWSAETFPYVYYTYNFFHIFKDIVVSGRENTIKPEPQIYQLCLKRNKLNPAESIFIDDNLDNVVAAENLGINGIHFVNPEQLYTALANLGVILTT